MVVIQRPDVGRVPFMFGVRMYRHARAKHYDQEAEGRTLESSPSLHRFHVNIVQPSGYRAQES